MSDVAHPSHGYWRFPGEKPEIYEYLGVKSFKVIVPTGGDLVRKHVPIVGRIYGLHGDTARQKAERVIDGSKAYEYAHLGLAAIITAVDVYSNVGPSLSVVSGQILVNGYPIMLQRYNRLRAYNILDRINQIESNKDGVGISGEAIAVDTPASEEQLAKPYDWASESYDHGMGSPEPASLQGPTEDLSEFSPVN